MWRCLTKIPNHSGRRIMSLQCYSVVELQEHKNTELWTWVWFCFSNCKPWITLKHNRSGKGPIQVLAQDEADKTLGGKVWILVEMERTHWVFWQKNAATNKPLVDRPASSNKLSNKELSSSSILVLSSTFPSAVRCSIDLPVISASSPLVSVRGIYCGEDPNDVLGPLLTACIP